MNSGPRMRSRSSISRTRARQGRRACAARAGRVPMATTDYPAMIFFISVSAQAIASLVAVPVTAFAIMFGRM